MEKQNINKKHNNKLCQNTVLCKFVILYRSKHYLKCYIKYRKNILSRLYPIHAKAMNGFYAPSNKNK